MTPRVVGARLRSLGRFRRAGLGRVQPDQEQRVRLSQLGLGHRQIRRRPISARTSTRRRRSCCNRARSIAPQAESPSTWYTDRKRLGVTSSLQYHPGDRFKIDVDLLYGRLWDHRDDYALASAGTNALTGDIVSGGQVIQSAVIDGNTLRAASYTGIDQRSEHHIVENHTDFYQGVANMSWKVTDRLTFTALGGYEESDFRQPVFDKVFMEAKNMAFSFDDRPTIPVNTYGIDLTNPEQLGSPAPRHAGECDHQQICERQARCGLSGDRHPDLQDRRRVQALHQQRLSVQQQGVPQRPRGRGHPERPETGDRAGFAAALYRRQCGRRV